MFVWHAYYHYQQLVINKAIPLNRWDIIALHYLNTNTAPSTPSSPINLNFLPWLASDPLHIQNLIGLI